MQKRDQFFIWLNLTLVALRFGDNALADLKL